MGMFYETDRMIAHRKACDICKLATAPSTYFADIEGDRDIVKYGECCDTYGDMLAVVIDFENNEGAFENVPEGTRMCNECDGPVPPGTKVCMQCGKDWNKETA